MRKYVKTGKVKKEGKKVLCALLCLATVLAGCGDDSKEGTQENATPTKQASEGDGVQGTPTKEAGQGDDAQGTPTEEASQGDGAQDEPGQENPGATPGEGEDGQGKADVEPTKEAGQGDSDGDGQAVAMRDMTTMEYVQSLGVGINLGNTFESCGWEATTVTAYETGWGSPSITPKMIEGYAKCGFGVMRIPVAWSNMMGDDYTINEKYLARVKAVVDCVLKTDMCVIVNIHWDGGWWDGFAKPEEKDECMYKYERIWTQLCEAFGDYNDHLMFESLNEEGCWDSLWNHYGGTQGKEEAYGLLNEINQKFVDIVRGSGGNNALRHLLIAGYATDIEMTCDELFQMPKDPADRCAVSVHYYTPSTFAILDEDASWGKMQADWGSDADYTLLYKNMDLMKEHFIDKGIPVIVGEFGSATKNKAEGAVNRYLTAVCEAAYSRGMCPVLWDITNVFYNRAKAQFIDEELLAGLMAVLAIER